MIDPGQPLPSSHFLNLKTFEESLALSSPAHRTASETTKTHYQHSDLPCCANGSQTLLKGTGLGYKWVFCAFSPQSPPGECSSTSRMCSCTNSLSFRAQHRNNSPNPCLATLPTQILYGLEWKMQILFSPFVPLHMNGDQEECAQALLARGAQTGRGK